MANKTLKLLRNQTLFEDKTKAIEGLKAQLITLPAGAPAIASYQEQESKVSVLLGIAFDETNYQIFEGCKIKEDGQLDIPESVMNEIKNQISIILGGASDEYNTLKKIEDIVKSLQQELDKTQIGAGLKEDGSYQAESGTFAIDGATSLKDADKKLDTKLKEVNSSLESLTATVEKNKVVAGLGITVDAASGDNTTISAKVKTGENALKVDSDGLYVDKSVLDKYQGSEAIAISEAVEGVKTVSLTIDTTDKVLTQSASGLLTNLSLKYIKRVTEGEPSPAKLQLLGKDDTIITDLDVNDFVMDGMLANAELEGDELVLTFNTDGGSKEIKVDLSKYIDVYSAGNGIEISGKSIAVKLDGATESFLTVSGEGVKLSGVQDAINLAKSTIDAYTVNSKAINTNPVLNGGDIKLDGYTTSVEVNDALQIKVTDTVNQGLGKLEKAIMDNEEVVSKAFDSVRTSIGLGDSLEYVPVEGANYISDATSVKDADSKLDSQLKTLASKLDSEVAKEYLTSVEAGNGIQVSGKSGNKQTISAFVKADDSILEVTSEGIKTKDNATWDCGIY